MSVARKLTKKKVATIKRDLPRAAAKFRLLVLPDEATAKLIKEVSGTELEIGDLFYLFRDGFSSTVFWSGKTNRYWANLPSPDYFEFLGYTLIKVADLDQIEEVVHEYPCGD